MEQLLVAYDIAANRRRRRVFKLLHRWGRPLQKSVFLCGVDPRRFPAMKRRLEREIRFEKDGLLFAFLCPRCAERLESSGLPLDLGADAVRVL